MGLCQGTVPPLLSQGCARLAGDPSEAPQQPTWPQHPKSSLVRGGEVRGWSADGSRAHAPASAWLALRPVLCPAQALANLGQRGRADQDAMSLTGVQCQELRSPLLPRQDPSLQQICWGPSTRSNGRIQPSPAQTPPLPCSCIHSSSGSAPPAQTPCSDLAPSSKLPVCGLWLDPSSPGEVIR